MEMPIFKIFMYILITISLIWHVLYDKYLILRRISGNRIPSVDRLQHLPLEYNENLCFYFLFPFAAEAEWTILYISISSYLQSVESFYLIFPGFPIPLVHARLLL